MCVSEFTSFLQVVQGPEDRVRQLALDVEKGGHATAGLVRVLHLGAKLIHDIPHWNLLLRRLHKKTE